MLAKVCGLTNAEDARAVLSAGADLLGFVHHPPSPRHCADLGSACAPARDLAVLVVVGDEVGVMTRLAEAAGIRRIQPHASRAQRRPVVEALRAQGYWVLLPWADEAGQEPLPADLYLWEPSPALTGVAGGSGHSHGMLHPPPGPFLLAGGLDGTTVRARAEALPPHTRPHFRGADAASRLERAPGLKNLDKVRAFIHATHAIGTQP